MFLLAYNLHPGETLVYEHITYLVVDEPGGQRHTGKAVSEMRQHVESLQLGVFTLKVSQQLLESSGLLANESREPRLSEVRMDRSGKLLGVGELQKLMGFPTRPVAAGEVWTLAMPGQPEFRYRLEQYQTQGVEILAHVVSDAEFEQIEQDQVVHTYLQAHTVFSVTAGCQISSQTAIKASWPDGRVSQTAVETRLLRRGAEKSAGR